MGENGLGEGAEGEEAEAAEGGGGAGAGGGAGREAAEACGVGRGQGWHPTVDVRHCCSGEHQMTILWCRLLKGAQVEEEARVVSVALYRLSRRRASKQRVQE